MKEIKIKTMTIGEIEEAKKTGYFAKIKGYDIYKLGDKLYCELQSVWSTYSDEARDNWAMILGGLKDKSEVMVLMSKED